MSTALAGFRTALTPAWIKNELWRRARAVPSLDLRFADNKSLVDATTGQNLVSFTRASSGTYVDSQGVIRTATTNLLLRSEEFDNASWTKQTNVSVTANQAADPNGQLTGDLITWTSASTNTGIFQGITGLAASAVCTRSIWVRADSAGGTVGLADSAFTQLETTVTLTTTWQRVSLTQNASAGGAAGLWVRKKADSPNTIYLWGAQLEQSSTVGEYIPTTSTINSAPRFDHAITSSTTNLLLRSEEFNDGTWGPIAGTVSTNADTSPSGTLTADKLIAANGGPAGQLAQGVTIASGATVTGSVYAKAGGFDRLELVLLSSNNTTPYGRSTFNPNTGAITTAAFTQNGGTNASSTVQALANGWYRFSVTVTYPAVTAAGMRLVTSNSDAANGDGVKGVFLWGAQLEQSSTVGAYVPTTTAAATSSTTESLGLLVEEQRTNSIRNNTMVGAVAGTPGTNPNLWLYASTQSNGLTVSIVGTGVENGINYIDYRFNGTTVASPSSCAIGFDNAGAATGQTWTQSLYWKLAAGTATGVNNWQLGIIENTAVGAFVTGAFYTQTAPTANTLIAQRPAATRTLSGGATVGQVSATLNIPVAGNTAIDFTLRLGLPQLEQGAFATSVIPTSTASATRSADVASISGSNFSSWFNGNNGTILWDGRLGSIAGNTAIFSFYNSSAANSNRHSIRQGNTIITSGGIQVANFTNQTAPAGARAKFGYAYAVDDYFQAYNSSTTASDTSGVLPTGIDSLDIGRVESSGIYSNGAIARLTYWPQRLSNSTLQSITQ